VKRIAREWVIARAHPQRRQLADEAGVSPTVAQLLLNRGVETVTQAREFLLPDFRRLLPPEALPNAVEAARILHKAARDGRRIVIYGDYDVDGITGTAILWHALSRAGADVRYYIPSRLEEGYGLNAEALRTIAEAGGQLVITVDCGVTAVEEAQRARELGLELIITDHHEPKAETPSCACLVHPKLPQDSANPDLSGAGVALKIAWAFAQEHCGASRVSEKFRELLHEATAFAALGLVADVSPMTGENRVIAAYGLKRLCHTEHVGLQALIEVSGLTGKTTYDDYDVGFKLAPRLNAIGRLGHARLAVELFTTADAARARQIAVELDRRNRERQQIEREILSEAEALVQQRGLDRAGCAAIVLAQQGWHPGVVGIVAARLVERFGRPTVLICLDGQQGQGSGRSIRHFPLHEALRACSQHLLNFGGHAMAAGLRLRADQVEPFARAFQAEAARRLTPRDLLPKLYLDDQISLSELTSELVRTLQRLSPHGPGNPPPRLATAAVELVDSPRLVGSAGNHLQFTVREGQEYRRAVAFGMADQAEELLEHRRVLLAFEPMLNEWNGRSSAELRVIDWKPADASRL
jgi:single-stranded-DNA-specific exonuclease